jgi:hypothetical protein
MEGIEKYRRGKAVQEPYAQGKFFVFPFLVREEKDLNP